jgi:pimeloyl-ACP methyl ester carboxylesterase
VINRSEFKHRGLTLSYLDSGPGPEQTVLLLHGFPDDATLWAAVAIGLVADGYRVIVPDTVGCGHSEMAAHVSDYSLLGIVSDHLALLDQLGIGRVHLIGHDWGALIAWFVAIYHGDRLRSLTAISVGHPTAYSRAGLDLKKTSLFVSLYLAGGLVARLLRLGGPVSLERLIASHPAADEVLERLGAEGRLAASLRIYQANLPTVLTRTHPAVPVPTLGIWGEADPFLVEAQMERTSEFVDATWRYERVGGGHWLPITHPDTVLDLFSKHVQRVESSR